MSAVTSASDNATRPPPMLDASTDALTVLSERMPRSRAAFRLAEPTCTRPVLSTARLDCASPIAARPPPTVADDADALPIAVPMTEMSWPASMAPSPMIASTVGVFSAAVLALPACTRPPPEPLADAVTMPSPDGAAVNARAPPTPPSNCVPLPALVRSSTSCPPPAAVRSTPSVPSVLRPSSGRPETASSTCRRDDRRLRGVGGELERVGADRRRVVGLAIDETAERLVGDLAQAQGNIGVGGIARSCQRDRRDRCRRHRRCRAGITRITQRLGPGQRQPDLVGLCRVQDDEIPVAADQSCDRRAAGGRVDDLVTGNQPMPGAQVDIVVVGLREIDTRAADNIHGGQAETERPVARDRSPPGHWKIHGRPV